MSMSIPVLGALKRAKLALQEGRRPPPVEIPDEGFSIQEMCDAASVVNQLCDAMGFEFRGGPLLAQTLHELAGEGHEVGQIVDGTFILPEEFE